MPSLRMPCELGTMHQQEAYAMTCSAALAVAMCLSVLAAACMAAAPLLVLLAPLYFVGELLFLMIWYYRYKLLSYQPLKHRPLSHDPVSSFETAMAHLKVSADIKHFLSIWFHGAAFEDIKRENVADLLAYAFFYKTRDEIEAEGQAQELEAMVQFIELTWKVQLPPGRNSKLRWMCHLWEPMRCWYQPLGFYLFMEGAALLGALALRAAGFRQSTWCGITYYTRNMPDSAANSSSRRASMQQQQQRGSAPPQAAAGAARPGQGEPGMGDNGSSGAGSDVPLVLLHGIGMGLIPYISLLFNMAATGRPLLALEFKHVSMRWVLWVPTVDEVAEVLVSILRREGVQRCCLVGHSYGTAVASRLLQQHPSKVVQTCMIDPVVFSMFMPNLLRNFLYEAPKSGNLVGDFMMLCAARDVHVSATLSRRFFWSDVNLSEEQLPRRSLVVLSGQDVLMAAKEIKSWLEQRTDATVMFHPELRHAGFLLDITWQQLIIKQLLPLLDSKVQQQQQQQQQPPATGLLAPMPTAAASQPLLVEDVDVASFAAGGKYDWHSQGGLQHQPATPQTHNQPDQSTSSSGTTSSSSRHSSCELTSGAGVPAAWHAPDGRAAAAGGGTAARSSAPAALDAQLSGDAEDDECRSRSSSSGSLYASLYTDTSNMSSSRASLQMDDVAEQQGPTMTPSRSAAAYGRRAAAAAEPAGSEHDFGDDGIRSWGGADAAAGAGSAGACSSDGSACSQLRHGVSRDSKGGVAAMALPTRVQPSPWVADGLQAGGSGAAPNKPPGPGLTGAGASPVSNLSSTTSNSNSCNTLSACNSSRANDLPSPFAAAAATAGEFSRQPQLLKAPSLQIEPLQSWSGVVASAPASCAGVTPAGSSVASTAAELESPGTFFSGCSSHSWQDLAALAAAKEAAIAARILLQPLQAMQRLRQASQRERKMEQLDLRQQQVQQVMWQRQERGEQPGPAAGGSSQQQAVSSKRDGMLRRVEGLLHRRPNRRSVDAAAKAASGLVPRGSGAGSCAR